MDALVSVRAMRLQRFLSLRQRITYLWENHNIQISKFGLETLYRRHGIDYRKVRSMNKSLLLRKPEYLQEKAVAAWELLSLIYQNTPMAYIDETTVMVNNLKTKTWQRSDSAVYSPKNDENLKSVTVYGCVGHPYVMDRPYLCTGTRTRGEELIPFLRRILELRRDGRPDVKMVLVMDRHSAHFGVPTGVRTFI